MKWEWQVFSYQFIVIAKIIQFMLEATSNNHFLKIQVIKIVNDKRWYYTLLY